MTRGAACAVAVTLALVAAAVFVGVGVHELNYASVHPYAYGPAKVIAWAAGAGALTCVALAFLAFALTRTDRR
jgi:hypothetical protein